MKKNLPLIIRVLVSALFLLSAFAKLYPTPMYGITKVFEEGQLIPMGLSEGLAPYFSRFIIAIEFFIAFAVLQKNYLKKLVIPTSIIMIFVFSLHLAYSIFLGDSENCGCFGELIPMSPLQALIKNVITIVVLGYLYKKLPEDEVKSCSKMSIQFLSILLLMFAFVPVQTAVQNKRVSGFSEYVVSDLDMNEGKKILCFFDAGCEHCMEAAKSLNELSKEIEYFPEMHIIFSDSEADRIPDFFEHAGTEYSHQVLPFYNEDDEINSYLEILGYEYENPAVIYLDNGTQIRFYDGTGVNAFKAEEFKKLFQ
jgi:thiol-disulfide isomerase/thioredoxin